MSLPTHDTIVIGGGYYGCSLALALAERNLRVALVEKEPELLQRASFVNQARVHNGYHYPRSLVTGHRSHHHYARFLLEFPRCIDRSFKHYYAIASKHSKVTPQQFATYCRRINAPLATAPARVKRWFNPDRVAAVFEVDEAAFDAVALAEQIRERLAESRVELFLGFEATRLTPLNPSGLGVHLATESGETRQLLTRGQVFNCTYSELNSVRARAGRPPIPLKHELTEIALITPPPWLQEAAVTLMCGPFFSTMPFPARGLHSLTHVRYTPHCAWEEPGDDPAPSLRTPSARKSNVNFMLQDAQRYLPGLSEASYDSSLWAIKTVLPQSELTDSRPILLDVDAQVPNLVSVLGSKIDNVYDLLDAVRPIVR